MSLSIGLDEVVAVLLADGWHEVRGNTFTLDAFEFIDGEGDPIGPGGLGFRFEERVYPDGLGIAGPLSSILAVRSVL